MRHELPVQQQPWRVGHRVPEHVYIGERPLVTMPTAALAALVVDAVNARRACEERFGQCVPVDATWSERVESAAAMLLLAGPADLLAALRDAGIHIVAAKDRAVLDACAALDERTLRVWATELGGWPSDVAQAELARRESTT